MFTSRRALAIPAGLLLVTGCAIDPEAPAGLGSVQDAVESTNTLTVNTLTVNTLTVNTLTVNTLTVNSLASGKLGEEVTSALQEATPTGASNRTVFHYIVTCALEPSQSVTYTWSDADGTYPVTEQGQIGLAPTWATESLRDRGQQLVSACIAARVNYFGVTVPISVRNQVLAPTTGSDELAAYPYVEGAFWGNLFVPNPRLHSCYDPRNVANSRADLRECATGYPEGNGRVAACGPITLTGSCDEQCFGLDPRGQFYRDCGNDDTMNAITVGLQ